MKRYLVIGVGTIGAVSLGLVVYGLFLIPVGVLRAWAVLATLALPAVAFCGWALGRYEATALLRGIDTGIDRVSVAATKLKTREPRQSPVQVAVLPQLPPVVHKQLTDGEDEVIDL